MTQWADQYSESVRMSDNLRWVSAFVKWTQNSTGLFAWTTSLATVGDVTLINGCGAVLADHDGLAQRESFSTLPGLRPNQSRGVVSGWDTPPYQYLRADPYLIGAITGHGPTTGTGRARRNEYRKILPHALAAAQDASESPRISARRNLSRSCSRDSRDWTRRVAGGVAQLTLAHCWLADAAERYASAFSMLMSHPPCSGPPLSFKKGKIRSLRARIQLWVPSISRLPTFCPCKRTRRRRRENKSVLSSHFSKDSGRRSPASTRTYTALACAHPVPASHLIPGGFRAAVSVCNQIDNLHGDGKRKLNS
ncbi:hypothetical protein BKA93DRAFT_878588 [Sparassis latifolia]